MSRLTLSATTCTLLTLVLAMGCTDKEDNPFGSGGTSSGTTDGGADDTGDTGGDDTGATDGGGEDGGAEEDQTFDEPGDVVEFQDDDGQAEIDLADVSGDSNLDQEFYLVMVHTETGALGYQLRYDDVGGADGDGGSDGDGGAMTPAATPTGSTSPVRQDRSRATSDFRQNLREKLGTGQLSPVAAQLPPPPYDETDIGTATREFRVRDSLVSETSYTASSATLWAIGDTVAIWVDDDVAIDWDVDCDGIVDIEHPYDAYGFDNCDLQTIADIVDYNIIPNIRTLFGDESDVNDDGLVSVVITPELNVISYTSDDEDIQGRLVGSYADPEVDLNDWDADENPVSDEQEVIYVFAPDPYGFYNPNATADVDEYTSMELAAQIARSFFFLVSYNQHVLVAEGDPEEDWLNQALGALAADLTGFGAVYYDDVWDYLDAPQLQPLVTDSDEGSLSTDSFGSQYLFARWIYDAFGSKYLAALVQVDGAEPTKDGEESSTTGTNLVAGVLGADFPALVVQWQVALLTSGVLDIDGDPLVDPDEWVPYADASTLSAPTSSPTSGDYYGANGYQTGIDLRGVNRYMEGGTTDRPVENANNRVTVSGTDFSTYVTGNEFWGYTDGEYAVHVVRLTDITFDEARLKIQGSGSGFSGAVVRWKDRDLLEPDLAVERIFSPTSVDDVELPVLPSDGSSIYAVGDISAEGFTTIVDPDGTETESDVYDTDRWLLDLSDFPLDSEVTVAIQGSRQYANDSGDAGPVDFWVAAVPSEYVPTPTVEGTQRGSCDEGVDFQYPTTMLEYLYYQLFLAKDDGSSGDSDAGDEGEEGAEWSCGEIQLDTSCGEDWDRDGILDENELKPTTFVGQVNAMQCTLNGNDATLFTRVTAADIVDADTLDDDDESSFDRAQNLGGMMDDSGEEAYLEATLEGGSQYIIVVGAYTYDGTYELEIKAID